MSFSAEPLKVKQENTPPSFHVDSFRNCTTLDQVLEQSGEGGAGFEEKNWIVAHPDHPTVRDFHDGKFYFFPGTARRCEHPTGHRVDYIIHSSDGFRENTTISTFQQWFVTSRAVMKGSKPRSKQPRR